MLPSFALLAFVATAERASLFDDRDLQALDALALAPRSRTSGAAPSSVARGVLRWPGFVALEWDVPSDALATFLDIPANAGMLAETRSADDTDSGGVWREHVLARTLAPDPEVLTLHQVGASALAVGRVRLHAPAGLGRVVELRDVLTGCSMEHRFELPQVIGPEGIELEFAWDLHSPVHLRGLEAHFVTDVDPLPGLPLALDVPEPSVVVEPATIELSPGGGRAILELHARGGPLPRLERLVMPPCCRALEFEADGPLARVEVEETPAAAFAHVCRPIVVELHVGDDPQPFSRKVRVFHRARRTGPDGVAIARGVFAPDEEVLVLEDEARERSFAYPQRFPEVIALHPERRVVASFRAPRSSGAFEALVIDGAAGLRVVGEVDEHVLALQSSWDELRTP